MLKPGQVVSCRVGSKQVNGDAVELVDNTAAAGFLLSNRDLHSDDLLKAVVIAIHTEQSYAVLREYSRVDELCDSIWEKAASELGVTRADLETVRADLDTARTHYRQPASERADKQPGIQIDAFQFGSDFDSNVLEILFAWAFISEADLIKLKKSQSAPNAVPVERLLVEFGCLNQANAQAVTLGRSLQTVTLGRSLCRSKSIDFRKFAVAFRDELDQSCSFRDSLAVRGWLPLDTDTAAV